MKSGIRNLRTLNAVHDSRFSSSSSCRKLADGDVSLNLHRITAASFTQTPLLFYATDKPHSQHVRYNKLYLAILFWKAVQQLFLNRISPVPRYILSSTQYQQPMKSVCT